MVHLCKEAILNQIVAIEKEGTCAVSCRNVVFHSSVMFLKSIGLADLHFPSCD